MQTLSALSNPFDEDEAAEGYPLIRHGGVEKPSSPFLRATKQGRASSSGAGSRRSVVLRNPFDGSIGLSTIETRGNAEKGKTRKKGDGNKASSVHHESGAKHESIVSPDVSPSRRGQRKPMGRACRGRCPACSTRQIIVLTLLALLLAVCAICAELYRHGSDPHILAWISAGVFVIASVPIAVHEIVMHMRFFTRPDLQRFIIRIIWLIPIYSVESWFALRFDDLAIYMQAARELYEAYVIYAFFYYLLNFLGEDEVSILRLLRGKKVAVVKHRVPFQCMRPWAMGSEFLLGCKIGVLQYVLVKVLTSILTFFCVRGGVYGEGEFDLLRGYVYVVFLDNVSQIYALYVLVLFYSALREELGPLSPFLKFACVKSVVFFSWWQGFVIQLLAKSGMIPEQGSSGSGDAIDVGRALQNWLICMEMFFAAIVYKSAFSYKDFVDSKGAGNLRFITALIDTTSPVDFITELGSFAKVPSWD
eukprot:g1749.t1